ncbi:hypothetical protein AAFF_G00091210, partial [Aldrovandia affinis]
MNYGKLAAAGMEGPTGSPAAAGGEGPSGRPATEGRDGSSGRHLQACADGTRPEALVATQPSTSSSSALKAVQLCRNPRCVTQGIRSTRMGSALIPPKAGEPH